MMKINLFQEVKDKVSAKTVAEHYGIKVKSNGMACCPFHNDKHPSLKVDDFYHCFACGASGDSIDFVARLFGLSQYDAAQKINQDFSLGIKNGQYKKKPQSKKKKTIKTDQERADFVKQKIQKWAIEATDILIKYLKWIEFWEEFYKPQNMEEEWHPLFVEALEKEFLINQYLDILQFGDGDEILELFEFKREEVKHYGERIEEYQRSVLAEIREYCERGNDYSGRCSA